MCARVSERVCVCVRACVCWCVSVNVLNLDLQG